MCCTAILHTNCMNSTILNISDPNLLYLGAAASTPEKFGNIRSIMGSEWIDPAMMAGLRAKTQNYQTSPPSFRWNWRVIWKDSRSVTPHSFAARSSASGAMNVLSVAPPDKWENNLWHQSGCFSLSCLYGNAGGHRKHAVSLAHFLPLFSFQDMTVRTNSVSCYLKNCGDHISLICKEIIRCDLQFNQFIYKNQIKRMSHTLSSHVHLTCDPIMHYPFKLDCDWLSLFNRSSAGKMAPQVIQTMLFLYLVLRFSLCIPLSCLMLLVVNLVSNTPDGGHTQYCSFIAVLWFMNMAHFNVYVRKVMACSHLWPHTVISEI